MPSTVSLVQPVVPAGSAAEDTPPSHLSSMSNQLSAIWVEPVALLPRAQTSVCHRCPACTGAIGATRYDGEPDAFLPVPVMVTDHLPERTTACVLTGLPSSGRYDRHGVMQAAFSKPGSITVAGTAA